MCRMERDWKKLEQHVKEQEVVSELDLMAYETVSCPLDPSECAEALQHLNILSLMHIP